MPVRPIIWLIDTSIFLNILNVPGRNQDRERILAEFETGIKQNDTYLMPMGTLVETGNHISRISEGNRFEISKRFVTTALDGFSGKTPWAPIQLPNNDAFIQWLNNFPNRASSRISFVDSSIIEDWENQKNLHPTHSVRIWSLDHHLSGYSS